MKKFFTILLCLCTIFLIAGCEKNQNQNNGDIKEEYNTYALKMNHWVKDGLAGETYKFVFRYDKDGNFKYYKYIYTMGASINDTTIDLSDEELLKNSKDGQCSKVESLNYAGFQTICGLRDGNVAMLGFIITDETIAAGILNGDFGDSEINYIVKEGLKEFNEASTETKAKEKFENVKDKLNASNGDSLIIANKKIDLNN